MTLEMQNFLAAQEAYDNSDDYRDGRALGDELHAKMMAAYDLLSPGEKKAIERAAVAEMYENEYYNLECEYYEG